MRELGSYCKARDDSKAILIRIDLNIYPSCKVMSKC